MRWAIAIRMVSGWTLELRSGIPYDEQLQAHDQEHRSEGLLATGIGPVLVVEESRAACRRSSDQPSTPEKRASVGRLTDLSLLEGEVTFGMNRIYLLFPEMGFSTTYFVSINTLVLEQCAEDIRALEMPKFVTWRSRQWLSDDPGAIFLDTDYTPPATFSPDVRRRVFEGSTVTYVALQLAFHMGFDEVILIGVDHNFTTKGPANETVISQGDDPNHFAPNYFGKGFRWQLPDLEASEQAYSLARDAFQADGRRVLDATIDGKLTVFPKVAYRELFS